MRVVRGGTHLEHEVPGILCYGKLGFFNLTDKMIWEGKEMVRWER